MTITLDKPICGIDNDIVNELYVLQNSLTKSYPGFQFADVQGLGCFTNFEFGNKFRNADEKLVLMTFEGARLLAKSYEKCQAMIIVNDDLANPVIFYVR